MFRLRLVQTDCKTSSRQHCSAAFIGVKYPWVVFLAGVLVSWHWTERRGAASTCAGCSTCATPPACACAGQLLPLGGTLARVRNAHFMIS
jgi:hypothetical protein